MGRPSLAEKRKAEILDAFGRCVAKYGLEGSTLEKIAEEADMRRSILRHFVGNRDELIDSLAIKVIGEYRSQTQDYLTGLAKTKGVSAVIEFLVPSKPIGSTEQLLVIEGLIGAAQDYPNVKKLVTQYVDELVNLLAAELVSIFDEPTKQECWRIAYGLVCISFNHESLRPLDLPKKYQAGARASALQLVKSLGETE